jgi:hypothetical protein
MEETYNPWTIVNLVFRHLAKEGLHPVLGDAGDPGQPAADLLTALGITPDIQGSRQRTAQTQDQLARLRAIFFDDGAGPGGATPLRPPDGAGDQPVSG